MTGAGLIASEPWEASTSTIVEEALPTAPGPHPPLL